MVFNTFKHIAEQTATTGEVLLNSDAVSSNSDAVNKGNTQQYKTNENDNRQRQRTGKTF